MTDHRGGIMDAVSETFDPRPGAPREGRRSGDDEGREDRRDDVSGATGATRTAWAAPWSPPEDATVVGRRVVPASPGRFEPLPGDLPEQLADALVASGIHALYAHQRTAIDLLDSGEQVLLTTGTASGKSLVYQLPTVARQLRDPGATVLMLHPTKALARDQALALARLSSASGLPAGTVASYDGDTPTGQRPRLRAEARTLVTNPDMLHAGILPHHTLWRRFLEGLSLIVMDEVHTYRGVFGSHVACVIRRLLRLARHYGATPGFVLTSATLGNPVEHASRIIGAAVRHVHDDSAPSSERELLMVQPPIVNEELGLRRSPLHEAARIAYELVSAGKQVLVFAPSRQGAEEAVVTLRGRVPGVRSYRSGLLPQERRAIEGALRDGSARAVVSTNALELGVDIGGVDAVVVAGYPGSAAAFRQQVGRAGRRDRPGTGILVLGAGPLDQYLAKHPERLFGAASEHALCDPDHLLIALDHLRCAAFELPLKATESFGGLGSAEVALLLGELRADGEVHVAGGSAYWVGQRYPAGDVSLRTAGSETVTLTCQGETIGDLDAPSARWMVHPDAHYLHDGRPYRVVELDLEHAVARLEPTNHDYLTRATRETSIEAADALRRDPVPGATRFLGDVMVTDRVTGYRRVLRRTMETLGRYPLDLAPTTLLTKAYGFAPSGATVDKLRAMGAWSNDANDYGPRWPQVRAAVKTRDAHRCQVCGTAEGSGTVLHVHHKVPFRAFQGPQEANRPENLTTLCPSCHRRAEEGVRVRSGLAAVAYALRSLAPLLVLCDSRDLGVHADPTSTLAQGAPALVIYETVPGGIGLAADLAERHQELIAAARDLIAGCGCSDGCPSCVGPAGDLGHAGKREAVALLEALS